MKNSRYMDEQIAFALKQAETGTSVAKVIRRMGSSEQTFHRWKRCTVALGLASCRQPAGGTGEVPHLAWIDPAERDGLNRQIAC